MTRLLSLAALVAAELRGLQIKTVDSGAQVKTVDSGAAGTETSQFCQHTVEAWFALMDRDQSGHLSQAELSSFLEQRKDIRSMLRGVTEAADDAAMLRSLDADGNGSVEAGEFRAYLDRLGFVETGGLTENHGPNEDVLTEVEQVLKSKMSHYPGIASVPEILNWKSELAGPYQGPPGRDPVLPDRPRVMSVHDMAGGYARNPDNLYLEMFQSWDTVDVFVYFSHIQLAVPPQPWIAAAHSHGALALGTIMFEPGVDESESVQSNQAKYIEQVVAITDHYGFDGWLVNVEAWSGGDPTEFVGALTRALREKLGKRSYTTAYPYTPDGPMFQHEAADSVFVNYGWSTDANSMERVKTSAKGKQHDIYMGLDAFGSRRGNPTPSSGNIHVCAEHDLSVAVFAPGYTLENPDGANSKYSPAAEQEDLTFWGTIKAAFGIDRRTELRDFPAFNAELTGQVTQNASRAGPTAGAQATAVSEQLAGAEEEATKLKAAEQTLQAKLDNSEMENDRLKENQHTLKAKLDDSETATAEQRAAEQLLRSRGGTLQEAKPVLQPAALALAKASEELQARAESAESALSAARTQAEEAETELTDLKRGGGFRQHYAALAAACSVGGLLFLAGRYSRREEKASL